MPFGRVTVQAIREGVYEDAWLESRNLLQVHKGITHTHRWGTATISLREGPRLKPLEAEIVVAALRWAITEAGALDQEFPPGEPAPEDFGS